jgi:hypothetical protein
MNVKLSYFDVPDFSVVLFVSYNHLINQETEDSDRRPPSPTLPPGIVNINLPVMETTGRDLKKRIDLPPFATVDDMEKAEILADFFSSVFTIENDDDETLLENIQYDEHSNNDNFTFLE